MDLGLSLSDNAYQFDTSRVTGNICQTNQLSNTAFRTFGTVQATHITEEILFEVAWQLGKTPEEVREKNLYKDGVDEWTQFEITAQTLGVLSRYGYDEATLAALEPLKKQLYDDEHQFRKAVNDRAKVSKLPPTR
ncbi:hypothetical protein C2W62_46005 [Candidatus Entotheonella serta]|nr:hypothetical protein C2W62_46005 [Candidatus Entotheonella serta]